MYGATITDDSGCQKVDSLLSVHSAQCMHLTVSATTSVRIQLPVFVGIAACGDPSQPCLDSAWSISRHP
jgi:hypothetical protein